MRSRLVAAAVVVLCLTGSTLSAQEVSAGEMRFQTGGTIPFGPLTFIDFSRPVTADGTITNASVRWLTDAACSDEIKIRFLRPGTSGAAGPLDLVGAAGPFAATNDLNVLTFPGIAVKAGDLIAVTQLKAGCGGVTFSDSSRFGDAVYEVGGDFNGGSMQGVQARSHATLDVVASNGPKHRIGTIPVAGAAAGSFGSFFRTALTIANLTPYPSDITIVYHPAGVSGSSSDPSLTVHLAADASASYDDLVTTLGQSGLGSIDIYGTAYTPTVVARVYNDAGASGTSGFTEELVPPADVITDDHAGSMPLAGDTVNYRTNVGIRTFDKPVKVSAAVYNAAGTYVGSSTERSYPATYFEQIPLSSFLSGISVPPGGAATIYVRGGSAVLYTATTDNRTNDGSLKMINMR
jgi:hypothetical protein